jgi:hypothetical protein
MRFSKRSSVHQESAMSIREKRVRRGSGNRIGRVIVTIVLLSSVSRAASALTQNKCCLEDRFQRGLLERTAPRQRRLLGET